MVLPSTKERVIIACPHITKRKSRRRKRRRRRR
jgi:hypothetical protein